MGAQRERESVGNFKLGRNHHSDHALAARFENRLKMGQGE